MWYRNSKILNYVDQKVYYINFEYKDNKVVKVNIEIKKMIYTDDIKLYNDSGEYQREYIREKYKDSKFNDIRKEKYKGSRYVFCNICKCNVRYYNRKSHLKSKKHKKRINDYNEIVNI
jgi:hypothetical protein